MARNMTITIEDTKYNKKYVYYEVPRKVANAIIDILDECQNNDSEIISAIEEIEER